MYLREEYHEDVDWCMWTDVICRRTGSTCKLLWTQQWTYNI